MTFLQKNFNLLGRVFSTVHDHQLGLYAWVGCEVERVGCEVVPVGCKVARVECWVFQFFQQHDAVDSDVDDCDMNDTVDNDVDDCDATTQKDADDCNTAIVLQLLFMFFTVNNEN